MPPINGEYIMEDTPWEQILFRTVLHKSGGIDENGSRASYAPWFKEAVCDALQKASYQQVANLTGISIRTLENFNEFTDKIKLEKREITELHHLVERVWTLATQSEKKRLDVFVERVQRQCLNAYGRDQITQALIDLGLRYPRGPGIKNEGTHKKKYFAPHALWEGDGKTMKIMVNGEEFSFLWYTFIDQHTTLLVGSSLTGAESAESFLEALKSAKGKIGFKAMGVLIDNRLTHEDKTAVKNFCHEHDIVLVNTFPGNSKSNGIIEGNFSIFEKQVGPVRVNGQTSEELARSFARNVIEIFTQQRNHRPRERLNGQTPADAAKDATRPEHQKSQLEKLRDRLLRAELSSEAKMQLIADIVVNFEPMSPESTQKFRDILKQFSPNEIIAAKARLSAQRSKHPESVFRSEYFFAILRYKREENAKAASNESYRASHQALNEMTRADLKAQDLSQIATKVVAFLAAASDRPGTTHILMSAESLCWGLMDFVAIQKLPELWAEIARASQRCRDISLRKWQMIAEFIHERLGMFMYPASESRFPADVSVPPEMRI
jgi:transposase InsO family protein